MFNALLRIDAALAATRPVWVGLGQLAVAVLGLHLAADRLDDHIYGLMVAVSGAVARVVVALGINAPEASAMLTPAAWAALIVELMVVLYMFDSLTFTAHRPELSWARFKEALSPHAVALPLFWLPAALAGAWVVGMAVEDALAPRDAMLGAIAGRGMGLLVAWRLSWSGFLRVLGGLSAPKRRSQGLLWAPVLLGLGTLAAWNGLPIWGWLP
ncbi:MAG: hypothetical protein H6739_41170 [Alphaproteobacteria bacterium]|nr:hypothetical protein [Alphaproteobacteria bacterium]